MDAILEAEVYYYLTEVLKSKNVVITKEPIQRTHYKAFFEGKEIITIKEEESDSDYISVYVTDKPFLYERKNHEKMQETINICQAQSEMYLTESQQIGLYQLQSILKWLNTTLRYKKPKEH